jgi:hypothetical protein
VGIVGSMDAITFELVKNAIPHYYEIISIDNCRAEVTDDRQKWTDPDQSLQGT